MAFINEGDKVWDYINSLALDEGLEVYDIDRSADAALKISVSKAGGESPSLADCSSLAKRLKHSLFAEANSLGLPDDMELDVSSPGLERHLRTAKHFEAAKGELVKVVSSSADVKGGVLEGILEDFKDGNILIGNPDSNGESGQQATIDFASVKKAKVKFVM